MKSWSSSDLLSHDARALNFTLYLQQHFIFAVATFKAIIFIMQQVLFVSQKYLNLQQLLKSQQQLSKIEATFKISVKIIKNCSNFKIAAEVIKNCSNFYNCSMSPMGRRSFQNKKVVVLGVRLYNILFMLE